MKQKPFKCVFCDRGFNDKETIWNHVRLEIGEKPFSCKICKKGLAASGSLRSHMLTHEPAKYKCDKCDKAYQQFNNLKIHLKKRH